MAFMRSVFLLTAGRRARSPAAIRRRASHRDHVRRRSWAGSWARRCAKGQVGCWRLGQPGGVM